MTPAVRLSRPVLAVLLFAGALVPAHAQPWFGQDQNQPVQQAQGSAADLSLRLNQLEEQNRRMNGRVEQLEFQNRQLQEQLKRFQEDIEFRLGGQGGANRPASQPQRSGAAPSAPSATMPQTATGTGPGAPPQVLGTLPGTASSGGGGGPLVLAPPGIGSTGGAGASSAGTPSIAAPSDSPDDEYALASGFLQRKDYDLAEVSFRQFTESHPQDRRVADALYGLGESFYQRGRHRDAIEPFLTVVTKHASSSKAPDSLLRLGQSLAGIGEKENACATFAEIDKKYPRATNAKSQGARERQRLGC